MKRLFPILAGTSCMLITRFLFDGNLAEGFIAYMIGVIHARQVE